MSKEGSRSKDDEQAPDLSALDFGPAWARPDQGKQGKSGNSDRPDRQKHKSGSGRSDQDSRGKRGKKGTGDQRGGDRGGGRDGDGGRGRASGSSQHRGGSGDGRRNDHRGGRREDNRGGPHKGGQRRNFSNKGGRERSPVVEAPEGVKARIMPIEAGMDAMAKQISATGRTHSVFDLAWLVLGALDRFHVIFESKQQPLYRSKSDHSVWMSQKECLAHMWSSGIVKKFYDEEITEIDPPAGNFQSVARCGISGKLIGPPNHHGYQQALVDLHKEHFSNMAIDRYKSKIVMEHGEEAVQQWIDAMRQHKRWRPKVKQEEEVEGDTEEVTEEVTGKEAESGEPAASEEPAQQDQQTAEVSDVQNPQSGEGESGEGEAPGEVTAQAHAGDELEGAEEEKKNEEGTDKSPEESTNETLEGNPENTSELESQSESESEAEAEAQEPQAAIEETLPIFDSRREVEQHFLTHGFEQEFENNSIVSALANIPGRMISPGLMTLLRNTVAEEKRYPGNLASILCRQMSGRHLAVFKWKKRLHCGPARPRHVSGSMVMADRPDCLFQWVMKRPGGNIDEMWKDCLPADIDDETRHSWYHDLHWLINEGLLLLLSDGTLHAAKEQEKKPATKNTAKKAAKKAAKKEAPKESEAVVSEALQEPSTDATAAPDEPPVDSPDVGSDAGPDTPVDKASDTAPDRGPDTAPDEKN